MAGATTASGSSPTVVSNSSSASSSGGNTSQAPVNGSPPFDNVLNDFASYSCVFTLASLSAAECNAGSFRTQPLDARKIVARTAGGFPENRRTTIAGKFDFYIDDVVIKSVASLDKITGNTNAHGLSFKIFEPYSIGLFYQSLEIAAKESGYKNYIAAPFLLAIEFFGHVGPETLNSRIPVATKFLVFRFFKVEMSVTERGAEYTIRGYPWNEQGYDAYYTRVPTEFSISGNTVADVLDGKNGSEKNLKEIVNQRLKAYAEKTRDDAEDLIYIRFPLDSSGQGENEIANSKIDFSLLRSAPPSMFKDNEIYDPSKGKWMQGKITVDHTKPEFKFSQGKDIVNIINQVIMCSDYAKDALKQENIDENGFIKWWKIEVEHKPLEPDSGFDLKNGGVPAADIYYKIIPYKIHASSFQTPNTKPLKFNNLKNQVLKEYNYIYTGKNLDILDFKILFNHGFYSAINADRLLQSGEIKKNAQESNSVDPTPLKRDIPIEAGNATNSSEPSQLKGTETKGPTSSGGGAGSDSLATLAARMFSNVVYSMSSMLTLDLTIVGDPYYLGDSGFGNQNAQPTQYFNMNSYGSINYQNGEVDIKVVFRNPVDPDPKTGLYKFPQASAQTEVVEKFTGLYKILTIESVFSKGKFTQTLRGVKRMHQNQKADDTGKLVYDNNNSQNTPAQ